MRVLWTGLGILGIAVLLTGCGSSNTEDQPHYKTAVHKPCLVPTGLADNDVNKLGIQIIQIGHNVRIIIPTDGVFVDRTPEIKTSAYAGLNNVASFLAQYPERRIVVTGYTDELGTYERDAKLSELQAQSLITYLWTQGIAHQCLTAIGMGKDETGTVASNRSLNGKAYNRRIEITFRA